LLGLYEAPLRAVLSESQSGLALEQTIQMVALIP
jgi:hypothetical protein